MESIVKNCNKHIWIDAGMSVIVKSDADMFASFFPTSPATASIEICANCGALRLSPAELGKVSIGVS
jgi:tRNA1(Val) A37 N6-methylase TrmN6